MSRIVMYDDSPTIINVVAALLKAVGHEVTHSLDPEEIFGRLARDEVDLLILDVQVPGLTGLDLLTQYRARHPASQVPVVFLTAEDDAETHDRIAALRATDYIRKPFNPMEMVKRILAALPHGAPR